MKAVQPLSFSLNIMLFALVSCAEPYSSKMEHMNQDISSQALSSPSGVPDCWTSSMFEQGQYQISIDPNPLDKETILSLLSEVSMLWNMHMSYPLFGANCGKYEDRNNCIYIIADIGDKMREEIRSGREDIVRIRDGVEFNVERLLRFSSLSISCLPSHVPVCGNE